MNQQLVSDRSHIDARETRYNIVLLKDIFYVENCVDHTSVEGLLTFNSVNCPRAGIRA